MVRIGINGFGRIGRLVFRTLCELNDPLIDIVRINELNGDASVCSYLINYDSVHGKWKEFHAKESDDLKSMHITSNSDQQSKVTIEISSAGTVQDADWQSSEIDIMIECSGVIKTTEKLEMYLKAGIKKVLVACPVKEEGVLNIVVGCNEHLVHEAPDASIITAASCTTNCIGPVIQAIENSLGIVHGSITTLHDLTNTQSIVDCPNTKKSDLRRARSALMNMAPTSTGSATAITEIFPQLAGKLDGMAVRVPLCNSSLTDLVLEVKTSTTVERVNEILREASELRPEILGFEVQPLVSTDYTHDSRSSVVDALSTRVIDEKLVKLYCWYDNEYGYANRMVDLTRILISQV